MSHLNADEIWSPKESLSPVSRDETVIAASSGAQLLAKDLSMLSFLEAMTTGRQDVVK